MSKKTKFKPMITRVKLNPEQAVLACSCYTSGISGAPMGVDSTIHQICNFRPSIHNQATCGHMGDLNWYNQTASS